MHRQNNAGGNRFKARSWEEMLEDPRISNKATVANDQDEAIECSDPSLQELNGVPQVVAGVRSPPQLLDPFPKELNILQAAPHTIRPPAKGIHPLQQELDSVSQVALSPSITKEYSLPEMDIASIKSMDIEKTAGPEPMASFPENTSCKQALAVAETNQDAAKSMDETDVRAHGVDRKIASFFVFFASLDYLPVHLFSSSDKILLLSSSGVLHGLHCLLSSDTPL